MDTSVKVQGMFSFSKLPIIILATIIIAYIAYVVIGIISAKINEHKKNAQPVNKEPKKKKVDINKVKSKYLANLAGIERMYGDGKIDVRESYQKMSEIIRMFVYEVTGIKVQNCSLLDINNMNMPELTMLMQEYYSPEFAQRSEGDVITSINKTKKAIEGWN